MDHMADPVIDGYLIRAKCDEKLMTLKELAEKSGVSYTHIKRIVAAHDPDTDGYQPRRRTVNALIDALGCSIEDISKIGDAQAGVR